MVYSQPHVLLSLIIFHNAPFLTCSFESNATCSLLVHDIEIMLLLRGPQAMCGSGEDTLPAETFYSSKLYSKYPVVIGSPSLLGISDSSFTLSIWSKQVEVSSTKYQAILFGVDGPWRLQQSLETFIAGPNLWLKPQGRISLGFYGACSSGCCGPSNTTALLGVWNHFAFVYDRAQSTQRIFLNGKQIVESQPRQPFIGSGNLLLGKIPGNTQTDGKALMQETRVFSVSLTQQQLQTTMCASTVKAHTESPAYRSTCCVAQTTTCGDKDGGGAGTSAVSDADCGANYVYDASKSAAKCAGATCDASGADRAMCCVAQVRGRKRGVR